jgi:hypothetical protein
MTGTLAHTHIERDLGKISRDVRCESSLSSSLESVRDFDEAIAAQGKQARASLIVESEIDGRAAQRLIER